MDFRNVFDFLKIFKAPLSASSILSQNLRDSLGLCSKLSKPPPHFLWFLGFPRQKRASHNQTNGHGLAGGDLDFFLLTIVFHS